MTREEEINYASKDYVNYLLDKQEYHNEDYTEDDIRQAFENGAMFADRNPDLSALWHDASEEPQEYPILCKDKLGNIWVEYSLYNYVEGWAECVEFNDIIQWAYISDLLPKGGEK